VCKSVGRAAEDLRVSIKLNYLAAQKYVGKIDVVRTRHVLLLTSVISIVSVRVAIDL